MKCPLLTIASIWVTPEQKLRGIDCLKEECAWWDKEQDWCVMMTIGIGFWILNKQMIGVLDKMASVGYHKK